MPGGIPVIAITDQRHRRVLLLVELDPDRPTQPLVPPASIGPLTDPLGLCVVGARHVVVADGGNGRVVVCDAASNDWSTFGTGWLSSPRAVVPDGDGLLIADTLRVVRVDDLTGSNPVDVLTATAGRVPLAVVGSGSVVDVATADGKLWRTDDGSTWRAVPLPGPAAARPLAMARGAAGPTYVCDVANRRLLAVGDDDAVTTVLDTSMGVVLPSAAAVAGDDLFVVDTAANRIRRCSLRHDDVELAEYVNGRAGHGTLRFDRVGGICEGSFT